MSATHDAERAALIRAACKRIAAVRPITSTAAEAFINGRSGITARELLFMAGLEPLHPDDMRRAFETLQ
jgi:hypothetical protein